MLKYLCLLYYGWYLNNNFYVKIFSHDYWGIISRAYFLYMLTIFSNIVYVLYVSESRIKLEFFNILFFSLFTVVILLIYTFIGFIFLELPLKKLNKLFINRVFAKKNEFDMDRDIDEGLDIDNVDVNEFDLFEKKNSDDNSEMENNDIVKNNNNHDDDDMENRNRGNSNMSGVSNRSNKTYHSNSNNNTYTYTESNKSNKSEYDKDNNNDNERNNKDIKETSNNENNFERNSINSKKSNNSLIKEEGNIENSK